MAGAVRHEDLVHRTGKSVENGYCESFNGKLRDEFLNGEIFYSLKEARILTERWRVEFNTERPHSALGYRPPAPQAIIPKPEHGDVENKTRFPHLHPRRLRTKVKSGVTLTFHLVPKNGQVTSIFRVGPCPSHRYNLRHRNWPCTLGCCISKSQYLRQYAGLDELRVSSSSARVRM